MKPILLKQVNPTGMPEYLYIVSYISDYNSLGKHTWEVFNILVSSRSDYEARDAAEDFMVREYSQSELISDWVLKEVTLIPSNYIVHAYNNLPSTNNS